MLLILAVSAGTLMTILFSLLKNAGKRDEIAELMAEEEEAEPKPREGKVSGAEPGEAEPWEKDVDWWRKS